MFQTRLRVWACVTVVAVPATGVGNTYIIDGLVHEILDGTAIKIGDPIRFKIDLVDDAPDSDPHTDLGFFRNVFLRFEYDVGHGALTGKASAFLPESHWVQASHIGSAEGLRLVARTSDLVFAATLHRLRPPIAVQDPNNFKLSVPLLASNYTAIVDESILAIRDSDTEFKWEVVPEPKSGCWDMFVLLSAVLSVRLIRVAV